MKIGISHLSPNPEFLNSEDKIIQEFHGQFLDNYDNELLLKLYSFLEDAAFINPDVLNFNTEINKRIFFNKKLLYGDNSFLKTSQKVPQVYNME